MPESSRKLLISLIGQFHFMTEPTFVVERRSLFQRYHHQTADPIFRGRASVRRVSNGEARILPAQIHTAERGGVTIRCQVEYLPV